MGAQIIAGECFMRGKILGSSEHEVLKAVALRSDLPPAAREQHRGIICACHRMMLPHHLFVHCIQTRR
jgi:hypothetical protein